MVVVAKETQLELVRSGGDQVSCTVVTIAPPPAPARPTTLDLTPSSSCKSPRLASLNLLPFATSSEEAAFLEEERRRRRRNRRKRRRKEIDGAKAGDGSKQPTKATKPSNDNGNANSTVIPIIVTDDDEDDEDEDSSSLNSDDVSEKDVADGLAFNVMIGFSIILVIFVVGSAMLYAVQKIIMSTSSSTQHTAAQTRLLQQHLMTLAAAESSFSMDNLLLKRVGGGAGRHGSWLPSKEPSNDTVT